MTPAGRGKSAPRLCLNMIVRNETAILERCLRSVIPHVHCYVICDTGSSDGTVELGRSILGEAGLPGEFHQVAFLDFAQARNAALDACRESAEVFDYILLLDADMELVVESPRWHERLAHPVYLMRQVSGGLTYSNVRLLSRRARARYVGVTHEYLDVDGLPLQLEGAYMLDHACGSSRSVKCERDIALLTAALEGAPADGRALFYLGQTLREAGRHAEAIAAYERRIAMGGWDEETWHARYMVARCHEALGDVPRFVAGCLEAYNERPTRAEPLHALALHYRNAGQHDACAMVCETALSIPPPADLLFVEKEVYLTGFRQEMSISGYYSKDPERRKRARDFCAELAVERTAPANVRTGARANWRFYARCAEDLLGPCRFVPVTVTLPDGYHPCNPSPAARDGQVWCVLRSVNYVIDQDGRYRIHGEDDTIRTMSYLMRLDADLRPHGVVPVVDEDGAGLPQAGIVGLEDIRIAWNGDRLVGICTVLDRNPASRCEVAVFDLDGDGRVRGLTLQDYENAQNQKNWVPFVDGQGLGFVYRTDPTVVLRWDASRRQCVEWRRQPCPVALDHLRGGSGAIPFDGGWLYVGHEVSHLGGRRTYLHRFVHLDAEFCLRAVTEPFYWRKVGIEFCSGLVAGPTPGVGADQLLVSFGVNDGEAFFAVLEAAAVRSQLQVVRGSGRRRKARPRGQLSAGRGSSPA